MAAVTPTVPEFVNVVVSDGSQDAGLAMLLLSRPPTNAMTRQVYREVVAAANELGRRDDVAAVILYGGHEIFSAGDDMPELRTLSAQEADTAARIRQQAVDAVAAIPKPTVAAITGYALGAGLTLALAADWRVSGDNVKFGATEILAGLIPSGDGMARLTRAAGPSRAKELVFSGRSARRRIEEARELIADKLGARPSEVIFTAGGTESDNLAVKGIYWARRDAEPHRRRIVTTEVEHHAVLDSVNWLVEHEGAHVTWLPTAADGSVSATALREALQSHDDVALVSVMGANNEVGTILPIAEMSVVAMEFGVPMHSDAIQAVGQLPLDFGASGLSAMSVAGHKFGGPPGVGALLLRRDVTCVPLMHGGGQERDIRSGTPDVASAVGMATAAQIAVDGLEENSARLRLLRDRLVEGVLAEIDDVCLNGADDPMRLAGNAHFTFRGCEGDALLMLLDANGIECSTGSACTAGVAQPSHVLIAMGVDAASARGSLRLSLGHTSVEADVDAALEVLPGAVARARRAALAAAGASR